MGTAVHAATITQGHRGPMTRNLHDSDLAVKKSFTDVLVARGEHARRRRIRLNLPLDRVAKTAGISIGKASEIERGIAVPNEQLVMCFEQAVKKEAAAILIAATEIVTDTDWEVA